jgi:HlyD family secretion protein
MRPGEAVSFGVDAFPGDVFSGVVSQVRLQPSVVQNVVTYSTVIAVPNPALKLKPGMTANVTIEIARRSNVLRLPNAATRFRPTREMFAALNQAVPQELDAVRASGGRGRSNSDGNTATRGTATAAAPAIPARQSTSRPGATIDSLFAPVQIAETRAMAWQFQNNELKPLRLRLGITDGSFTEIVNATETLDQARVVTSMTTGLESPGATTNQNRQSNPLMGPQPPGPGRGGPGGFGGGR